MDKFFNLSEENANIVNDVFQETGLHHYMDIKILGTGKAKEVVKVSKTNPIAETLGNCPGSIVCVVFEEVFDKFDEQTKKMLVDDAISVVSYDFDKDKIKVGAHQITVTLNGLNKYGKQLVDALETSVIIAIEIEEEKKQAKKNG